jgi:hypothetical protein
MVINPDIVILIICLACFITLLSIIKELRKITRTKKRKISEWSFEDQLKLRVKYLHQCRHLENHANSLRPQNPETFTSGITA